MNERTVGAWVLHHASKLSNVQNHDFEEIDVAGKAGRLLSGLVASHEESNLSHEKVKTLAKIANINRLELNPILELLKKEQLIEVSGKGEVQALGVTTASVLQHTASVFTDLKASNHQLAAIALAERISSEPTREKIAKEYVGDVFKLSKDETASVIEQSAEIGFIDVETVDNEKLLFNGNLFKVDGIEKAKRIMESLIPAERSALHIIDEALTREGVMPYESALKVADRVLLEKVQSVGMYEFNKVINSDGEKLFITKPTAFAKFGNPFEVDALDLAKALIASLSYGVNYSPHSRGRIWSVSLLLRKLINGLSVGPATAIGQDYKYLEVNRVVQIIPDGGLYRMRLLKRDIGELAYQVMSQGDANEQALLAASSNMHDFEGPEANRVVTRRRKRMKQSDADMSKMLRTLRKNN